MASFKNNYNFSFDCYNPNTTTVTCNYTVTFKSGDTIRTVNATGVDIEGGETKTINISKSSTYEATVGDSNNNVIVSCYFSATGYEKSETVSDTVVINGNN